MRFEHAPAGSYEDVASGQVLYSAPGFPAFPARLGIELFKRGYHAAALDRRASLWDPMCGAGGLAATLGLLCADWLETILATDISSDAIALARRNLDLVSAENLSARAEQLAHRGVDPARIASARHLIARLGDNRPGTRTALADATDRQSLRDLDPGAVDIVLTDLPYGRQTHWETGSQKPFLAMVEALQHVLPRHAVMIFAASDRKVFEGAPPALRSFKHGHRTIKMYRVAQA